MKFNKVRIYTIQFFKNIQIKYNKKKQKILKLKINQQICNNNCKIKYNYKPSKINIILN